MQLLKQYRTQLAVAVLSLVFGALGLSEYKKYLSSPEVTSALSSVFESIDTPSSPVPIQTATTQASISAVPQAGSETAVVASVIDGDTVLLTDGRKVRYVGIDAPEAKGSDAQVTCYGAEATAENMRLVAGKSVSLEKDTKETDKYGRLLRYVYVDGNSVSKALVAGGFARSKWYPPDTRYQNQLDTLQITAQQEKKGLWGVCN